jgi:ppGpp synthetase/RelA/SpoT-type nucleotidyltranferase
VVRLSKKAQLFVSRYAAKEGLFKQAASQLQLFVTETIADLPLPIHVTIARAKRPASLRSKCRRKGYINPAVQVTDLLAVRVITYFKDHLDAVAERLRQVLDVSEAKSRDTRKDLAENEFGYRSVHLVARLRRSEASTRSALGRRWFGVQVRSILDHAWSEIEHETIYKSGISYPSAVRRRFKAVAASLEVLEDAFAALSHERDKLIDQYRSDYSVGRALESPFDVARLQAFLEWSRPSGVSWRLAEQKGVPFAPGTSAAALEALESAGLSTARRLSALLNTQQFKDAVLDFAAMEGIAPAATSHLAVVVLAVAVSKPALLQQQFPEMLFSPSVSVAAKL